MESSLVPGSILADRYRTHHVLGRGGMGVTYAAEPLAGGPAVAVKVLHFQHAESWKAIELFEREARVLAQLDHPSIPAYVESFSAETPQGAMYCLVQTLAPGESLASLVERHEPFTEAEVKRIAAALLGTLCYLQGFSPPVIHRDIKPQNVLRDSEGRIYLVDFGAVRDTYRNTLTQGATLVGTLGYMAPEQFRGAASASTDLYGLGATLIHLLTGRNPSDLPHTKLKIDVRKCTRVSPSFAAWLERMLTPAEEERFASPEQALDALLHPPKIRLPKAWKVRTVVYGLIAFAIWGLIAKIGYNQLWGYLRRATRGPLAQTSVPAAEEKRSPLYRLAGHWSVIFDVAFTADDKRLVSGSNDRSNKLWDIEGQRALLSFAGHTGPVGGVALLPDGTTLASGGDHTVRLWSLADGKLKRTFNGHDDRVTSVAATSDGARLVSGSFDGTVRVWSVESGAVERTMKHGGRVLDVEVFPDGKRAASVGDGGDVLLWSLGDGSRVGTLQGHRGSVGKVAVASDGQTLATAGDDGYVRIWAASAARAMWELEKQGGEAWAVAFSPDGTWVAASGEDDIVRIYKVYSGKLVTQFAAGQQGVTAISYSHDGQRIATGGATNTVLVWSVADHGWRPPLADAGTVVEPTVEVSSTDTAALMARVDYLLDSYGGQAEKLHEARALTTRVLELDPKHARAHAMMGRVTYKAGYLVGSEYKPESLEKALGHVDRALELDPTCFDAHVVKSLVHLYQKDVGLARRSADKALEQEPGAADAKLLLARIANAERNWSDVEQRAKEVLESDARPLDKASAYTLLVPVFEQQQNWEAIDICHRSIINLDAGSAWAKGNYAAFLNRRSRFDEAVEWGQKALAQRDYPMGRHALAGAHYGKGAAMHAKDADAACKRYEVALKVDPRLGAGYYGRGICLRDEARRNNDKSRLAAAEQAFRKAIELEPKWDTPKKALANLQGMRLGN